MEEELTNAVSFVAIAVIIMLIITVVFIAHWQSVKGDDIGFIGHMTIFLTVVLVLFLSIIGICIENYYIVLVAFILLFTIYFATELCGMTYEYERTDCKWAYDTISKMKTGTRYRIAITELSQDVSNK